MPCPHPGILVGGRCYFCCKQAAVNGHRSRLSVEQLGFVGFATDTVATHTVATPRRDPHWIPATNPSNIDDQLEELERLRDIAPNWIALARRILEDDGAKS